MPKLSGRVFGRVLRCLRRVFWLLETGLAKPSFLIDVSSGLPVLALPARVVLVHGRRLCTVFMVKERGNVCDALVGGCESVLEPLSRPGSVWWRGFPCSKWWILRSIIYGTGPVLSTTEERCFLACFRSRPFGLGRGHAAMPKLSARVLGRVLRCPRRVFRLLETGLAKPSFLIEYRAV